MNNAKVRVRIDELDRQLPTIQTRFGASFQLKILDVPNGVDGVFVRVFKAQDKDGYFDCPANQDGNGDWECYMIGTTFPEVGRGLYEIHASDEAGNPTSLGVGNVSVKPFSAGSSPITQGSEVSVATLPDETGALHQVVAVNLGDNENPDWSWKVKTVNGAD